MKKKLYLMALVLLSAAWGAPSQTLQKTTGTPQTVDIPQTHTTTFTKGLTVFTDSFETYSDFVLTFSPWTLTDLDGSDTYGMTDVDWPNVYAPQAYMVFNPSSTTPPQTDAALQAHTGSKYAACFAATSPPNNDWLISPPLECGTNTSVSFWVKSYTDQYGLERYNVAVSTTNTDPGSFTVISGSNYLTAPITWQQKTYDLNAYNGQTIYVAIQCVSNDAFIFMVDDFAFTTTPAASNTLTGMVTDAYDGTPIQGASVSIAGLSTTTDADGNYTITNVPAGTLNAGFSASVTQGDAPLAVNFIDQSTEGSHTVTCAKTGYITYVNNQVVIPTGGTLNLNISLSQTLSAGAMRFVLNWGAEPRDLDSHLNTPLIDGNTWHIYYSNQGSATSAPWAALDHDITSGYGPETMTIYQMFDGTYQYYVYKYAGDGEITQSGAVLQIYNEFGLMQTLAVPVSGTGRYWYVCDVNGSNGQLNIHNVIQETAPGKNADPMPPKKPEPATITTRSITSWLWNFGDGTTSNQANPSHTYTTAGTYTVSLTVTNATMSDTETRTGYITVNGSTGTSTLTGMVTNAIDGQPVAGALVQVAGLSATTDASGNYTINNIPAGALVANFNASTTTGVAPLMVSFTDQSTENANTVVCSRTDFITYTNTQVVIPIGGSLTLNISLSPILQAGNMRFVLNWGASPSDLDSHLDTPVIGDQAYHVYYGWEGYADQPPYAALDYDITSGYGPETMTIYDMYPGTYKYYIYNYSGSPEISTSEAVVQIYNDMGLVSTLQVPTTGTGLYWYICDVNGTTGGITIHNIIQEESPGMGKQDMPVKPEAPTIPARTITSWYWDFGDGSTSTAQNPVHTFNANGRYTISLTTGNGVSSDTEVKTDYILVGPQDINESTLASQLRLWPVPAQYRLSIQSPVRIDELRVMDLSGRDVFRMEVGQNETVLDVSSLRSGAYLLHLQTPDGHVVKRFTVR